MYLIVFFKSLKGFGGTEMYKVFSGAYNIRLNPEGGLAVPFARTNLYKKSIRVDAVVRWNSLPVFRRQFDNYNSFKINLKHYWMCRVL